MRELRPLTPDRVGDLVGSCAPCTFWQTVPRNGHSDPERAARPAGRLGRDGHRRLGPARAHRLRRRTARWATSSSRPRGTSRGWPPSRPRRPTRRRSCSSRRSRPPEHAGRGLRKALVQAAAKDALRHRVRSLEAVAARPLAVSRHACVLDVRLPREGRLPGRTRPPGIPPPPDRPAHGRHAARRGSGSARACAGPGAGRAARARDATPAARATRTCSRPRLTALRDGTRPEHDGAQLGRCSADRCGRRSPAARAWSRGGGAGRRAAACRCGRCRPRRGRRAGARRRRPRRRGRGSGALASAAASPSWLR